MSLVDDPMLSVGLIKKMNREKKKETRNRKTDPMAGSQGERRGRGFGTVYLVGFSRMSSQLASNLRFQRRTEAMNFSVLASS